jgi:hypothetical protein
MRIHNLIFCFSLFGLLSCQKYEDFRANDPSYAGDAYFIKASISDAQLGNIFVDSPKAIEERGDAYVDSSFLYIGEKMLGVHVFKNPEGAVPIPLAFIHIPAMRNFRVEDGHIISDNGNDLIAYRVRGLVNLNVGFSLSDPLLTNPSSFGIINRKANVFTFPNYPEVRNVYFQCPDSVGYVTKWETKPNTQLLNCYR